MKNKIFSPINLFKLFLVVSVVSLSTLVFFGDSTGLQKIQLNLANQMLLSILLIIYGVQGLQGSIKQKRVMAYTALLVALFILGLTIITLLKISNLA